MARRPRPDPKPVPKEPLREDEIARLAETIGCPPEMAIQTLVRAVAFLGLPDCYPDYNLPTKAFHLMLLYHLRISWQIQQGLSYADGTDWVLELVERPNITQQRARAERL